ALRPGFRTASDAGPERRSRRVSQVPVSDSRCERTRRGALSGGHGLTTALYGSVAGASRVRGSTPRPGIKSAFADANGNRGPFQQETTAMLPIGDDNSGERTFPIVTYVLIALNVLFFFVEISSGDAFVKEWAFVPSRFLANPSGDAATLFT